MIAATKLTPKQVSFLVRLYNEQPLGNDKLAYSPEFNKMVRSFQKTFGNAHKHRELYHALVNLRKAKKLLRKTKSKI